MASYNAVSMVHDIFHIIMSGILDLASNTHHFCLLTWSDEFIYVWFQPKLSYNLYGLSMITSSNEEGVLIDSISNTCHQTFWVKTWYDVTTNIFSNAKRYGTTLFVVHATCAMCIYLKC